MNRAEVHPALLPFAFPSSGDLKHDLATFFKLYGQPKALARSLNTATEAKRIGLKFGERNPDAEQAALLCRLSCVVGTEHLLPLAQALNLEILPAEEQHPNLLRQKISASLAEEIFGIKNTNMLSAISIHESLHPMATWTEKIVFLASKFITDTELPYLPKLEKALSRSIDESVFVFLSYARSVQSESTPMHPLATQTYTELAHKFAKKTSTDNTPAVQNIPLGDKVKSSSMHFNLFKKEEEK